MTQLQLFSPSRGANLSPCRKFRYALWRKWGPGQVVAFIGLNPSTADEQDDDATIRRCVGFAKRWGYDGIFMLNLFAYRATQPSDLVAAGHPVGPLNDEALATYCGKAGLVVACWGANAHGLPRVATVLAWLDQCEIDVYCFGRTNGGDPLHPLRLPGDLRPVRFAVHQ